MRNVGSYACIKTGWAADVLITGTDGHLTPAERRVTVILQLILNAYDRRHADNYIRGMHVLDKRIHTIDERVGARPSP